jgi:hypothetical protein
MARLPSCVAIAILRRANRVTIGIGGEISVPGMDHAIITFINNGQTPAYNIVTYSGHAIVEFPLPDNADFSMIDTARGSFADTGADGERNVEFFVILSSEDGDAISKKKKAIFFWGRIDYRDIFKSDGDVCCRADYQDRAWSRMFSIADLGRRRDHPLSRVFGSLDVCERNRTCRLDSPRRRDRRRS